MPIQKDTISWELLKGDITSTLSGKMFESRARTKQGSGKVPVEKWFEKISHVPRAGGSVQPNAAIQQIIPNAPMVDPSLRM